jgi:hypothetical protein
MDKPYSEFYKRTATTYRSSCKSCIKEYQNGNRDKKCEYDKNRYVNNKDVLLTNAINNYHANPIKKKMYDSNRRHIIYEQRRTRYKNDVGYKVVCNLRSRLYQTVRRAGGKKSDNTISLLGCSKKFFIEYIENLFTDGMSWEKILNGEIHLDHIRPCSSFDLSEPDQQKICFHYTNLQPLWAKDNRQKYTKYEIHQLY